MHIYKVFKCLYFSIYFHNILFVQFSLFSNLFSNSLDIGLPLYQCTPTVFGVIFIFLG